MAVITLVISSIQIGNHVQDQCAYAVSLYGSDCVTALGSLVQDANRTYGERNNAIWALGQLGDARGLPILEKYYTGVILDKEPWNGVLSQYELGKAIKLLRGGFNLTSLFRKDI